MATILVLAHERDGFHARPFLLKGFFSHWIEAGHFVVVHTGTRDLPSTDVAILHVDLTVVPPEYLAALNGHPVVVNGATATISKRTYSQLLVGRDDGYTGPVIVKTDANAGGQPEVLHARAGAAPGAQASLPVPLLRGRYPIYRSAASVPEHVWRDPRLVVERFVPERDPRGYALRVYTFFGDRERATRVVGRHPVVKGQDIVERIQVSVPDELRQWRRRLGFDYGKFDYVVHEGRPILLDANRTPTIPGNLAPQIHAGMKDLADGIDSFLR